MIPIYKNTKVYIVAPAAFFTGGPIGCHQLAEKLLQKGINASIVYFPQNHPNPMHPNYKDFKINFNTEIIDNNENIIIVPEVMTGILYKFKKIRKAIWWLSVDNYYIIQNNASLKRKIAVYLGLIKIFKLNPKEDIIHFAQSQYAFDYLQSKKLPNIYYLPDYLPNLFFEKTNTIFKKEDIVLYNPVKGTEFTKKIIEYNNGLIWIPLKELSQNEVKELLLRAKLYIDFGGHPGRDRFPREAVLNDCCIITGNRGSAYNNNDISIHKDYKFNNEEIQIPIISKLIYHIINNYEQHIYQFKSYKNEIVNGEKIFLNQLNNIFEFKNQ